MPTIKLTTKEPTRENAEVRRMVDKAIAEAEIRMELKCGGEVEPHAVHAAQFTLDKTKYRLRLTDETEESVKVWIERKD